MQKKEYNAPECEMIRMAASEILLVSNPELPLDPLPDTPEASARISGF